MFFLLKVLLSGVIIALASWLAAKKPILAGFIVALPLISALSILFSYWQSRDMEKINRFASSIFVAIPLSLAFFVPFLLNRWLKMNFAVTFILALLCVTLSYYVACTRFKINL